MKALASLVYTYIVFQGGETTFWDICNAFPKREEGYLMEAVSFLNTEGLVWHEAAKDAEENFRVECYE